MTGESWSAWIRQEKKKKGLTNEAMARDMNVSETTVKNLLRDVPKSMDNVVMLGMLLGLEREEIDRLLREMGFHQLYAKNPGEAVWIYLIQRGCTERPAARYAAYYQCYETLVDEAEARRERQRQSHQALYEARRHLPQVGTTQEFETIQQLAKEANEQGLPLDPGEDHVFRSQILRLVPGFRTPYQRLYKLIYDRVYMRVLSKDIDQTMEREPDCDQTPCLVDLFGKTFSSRFSQIIISMLRDGQAPSRSFLIALALRLDMTSRETDQLLRRAGYRALTPGDHLEGSVLALLEELEAFQPFAFASHELWELPLRELVFPEERRPEKWEEPLFRDVEDCTRFLSPEEAERLWGELEDDGGYWEDQLAALAPREMGLDDSGFIPELTVADYVKRRLEQAGETFRADAGSVQRLLHLLETE